jgi:WD40 repeat protein
MLWDATTGNRICTLRGHEDEVESVAFSPDGLSVVTASQDATARVWQASTCQARLILKGHTAGVDDAIYSPDGQWIATAGKDDSARIWNAESGAQIQLLSNPFGGMSVISFSPDAKSLVTTGGEGMVRVWDVSTGREIKVLIGHEGLVPSVAFSSDGQWIVTSGSQDNTARLWDAATGTTVAIFRGHTARVNDAAMSPDKKWVATAGEDGTARIWSTVGYEVSLFPGSGGASSEIAFSDDRSKLAGVERRRIDTSGRYISPGVGRVWIWDVATGDLLANLSGYNSDVEALSFSPDAQWLATGHYATGMVRIWEAASGRRVAEWQANKDSVSALVFTPDGRWLISAGKDGSVHVWSTFTWKEALAFQEQIELSVVLSPNGRWLVGTSRYPGVLRIWDSVSWREVAVSTAYAGSDNVWNYHKVSFSPDGRWLGLVHLVSLPEGGQASVLQIWETTSWTRVYEYRTNHPADGLYFSPDSRLLAFNDDYDVKVVETGTWRDIVDLQGHTDSLSGVDYSHDMQRIVTSSYDRTARVWNPITGEMIASVTHEDSVFSASFSPDDQRIVTASEDGTVKLWEAATGTLIADLRGYSGSPDKAWFSADGRRIITLGSGEVRIYAGTAADLLELAASRSTRELTCEERVQYLHEVTDCAQQ